MGKKTKKGGMVGDFSDEEEVEVPEVEVASKKGPKKPVKGKESDDEGKQAKVNGKQKPKDDEEEDVSTKATPKKGKKQATKPTKVEEEEEEEEEKPSKQSGKKKVTKQSKVDDEDDEDTKPKSSKKSTDKGKSKKSKVDDDNEEEEEEEEDNAKTKKGKDKQNAPETTQPKKKKKKKGGNWQEYQEDDDEEVTKDKEAIKDEEPKGKGKKETKKTKKEVEEEEESDEPTKGKGKKNKQEGKAKKAEEDEEEEEEVPAKGKGKNKKQEGKAKKKAEEEDEEEEEIPAKGKGKNKKQEGKAKKKAEEEDEDEEEEEEEEAPAKGKGKNKKQEGKAKKKVEEEDEDEEEEVAAKGKGKKQEVKEEPTKGPKGKKGKKKGGDDYWDEEFEKDAEAASAPAPTPTAATKGEANKDDETKKDKKKKKKKAQDASATPSTPAAETPIPTPTPTPTPTSASDKPKGKSEPSKQPEKKDAKAAAMDKIMAKRLELLRKQKEEREQAEKLAEEIRKKEEEEERILLEEERKRDAELRAKKEAKKKLKQTNAVAPSVQMQNIKNAAFVQSLREKGLLKDEPTTTAAAAPGEKKKTKVYVYAKKKPTKKADAGEAAPETTTAAATTTITPTPAPTPIPTTEPEAQKEPEPTPEQEEEEEDNWENWEDHDVDKVVNKLASVQLEEPKQPEPKPVPEPVPEPVATPISAPAAAPAPQKKVEENGKAKAGGKKADKKTDKKGGKKGDKKDEKDEAGNKEGEGEGEGEPKEKELRSPICCILGHVDTGKTSLLDKIRNTDVQGGEAGGITQQIGATYFPFAAVQEKTKALTDKIEKWNMKVPGLLVIDTPGHESFTNLRSRGSGLCDIAILVVDIMHALEPQTIESINLLRMRKTPFIVALNKVDRLYGWRSKPFNPFRDSLKIQDKSTVMEFEQRTKETIAAFAEVNLNACLYYKNKDFGKNVSLVPTSAHTGEGIPDLLMLLVQLTQKMMQERLHFTEEVQCTVLEVKVIEGLGTTLDVILVNGVLREGDTIVLGGLNGPIVTTIRAVLTPQPLRELRVKGAYEKSKEIKAAMGVKIVAQDLEKAIAGSALFVARDEDEIEEFKGEVQQDFDSVLKSVDSSSRGVCVQASTLGSLEALLTFLKTSKIPVSGVGIGNIHKRDVIKASAMLEKSPEFAVILAFDVKIEKDAQAMADDQHIQIFTADIIYHLFDQFTKYMDGLKKKKREAAGDKVVWPCILQIKPDCIFNSTAPIVVGMTVLGGTVRIGTPLCIPGNNFLDIGVVTGIEKNHKQQLEAKKGEEVAVKIESAPENAKVYGRHFDLQHDICSKISRESIDLLVSLWGDELSQPDRQLIQKLKVVFKIQ